MLVLRQSVGVLTGPSVRSQQRGALPGVVPNTPNQAPFLSSSLDRSAHSPPPNLISRAAPFRRRRQAHHRDKRSWALPHGKPATSSRLGSSPEAELLHREVAREAVRAGRQACRVAARQLIWLSYILRASSVWMALRALSSEGTVVSVLKARAARRQQGGTTVARRVGCAG